MQRVARYGIAHRINAEVIAILAIGRDWFVVWDCAIIVLSHCHFQDGIMRSARWANSSAPSHPMHGREGAFAKSLAQSWNVAGSFFRLRPGWRFL